MISKLFFFATVALSLASAQTTSTFKFSEVYPAIGSSPPPKPEWLELIKNVKISPAPVYNVTGGKTAASMIAGDPYCDWTFTQCLGPEDISQCPKGQWGITYDDGPSQYSPPLYDLLDQTKTKATFFMVGGQVNKYPEYVMRAYKSGHDIAMHTWSHSYMTSLTNEQIVGELKWNEQIIKEVIGVSPIYFRPPYGDIDNRVRDVAKALGFIPIIWNHDSKDWAASFDTTYNRDWIYSNVTQWAQDAATATVGGVSLEHDLYNSTVDIALRVLPILQKSYNVTSVGACTNKNFYKGDAVVPAGANGSSASSVVGHAPSTQPTSNAAAAAGTTNVLSANASGQKAGSSASSLTLSTMGVALAGAIALVFA
ncbi:hypothetical protein BDF14DRAFT_1882936 [Spinellus fusiger]|nr:hypothetical protein BDF14DRAFT_1882936 [Spinellus fusiger]